MNSGSTPIDTSATRSQPHRTANAYRPDIDGLRAIAVTLVVLYHAGLAFPGGFIGVDVFFVISGYLITQKLLEDHERGIASITTFYSRRARRILPALSVVYLACLCLGSAIMLPIDLREIGRSTVTSALFVSNFYFYSVSGYFDGPAHEKPLLHTWSLSVEEQFYVLWPILCYFLLLKNSRQKQVTIILFTISISLAIAVYLQTSNPSAAFYWPASRAWELLSGALLAVYRPKFLPVLSEMLSALGLLSIIISGFLLNSRSPVPGIAAIPAITGSAILIGLGSGTSVSNILSNRWAVRLGLISYSLYLWHWPVFAFTKYYLERDLTKLEATIAVIASLVMAAFSWRFVEQPIRKATISVYGTLMASAATIVLFSTLGSYIFNQPHVDTPVAIAQAALRDVNINNPLGSKCHNQKLGDINISGDCRIGAASSNAPDFILIGDSHADHFSPAFDEAGREIGLSGIQITHGGCLPIWGIAQVTGGKTVGECDRYREQVLGYIKNQPPGRVIVVAARWIFYANTTGPNVDVPYFVTDPGNNEESVVATQRNMTRYLRETINMLSAMGHRTLVVAQVPEFPFFRLNCFLRHAAQKNAGSLCGESRDTLSRLAQPAQTILTKVVEHTQGALIVRPADLLCQSGRCVVERNGIFLYRDLHHLNLRGAQQLSRFLSTALKQARSEVPPK